MMSLKGATFRRLVIQLTGRTADLFLLDELNRIEAVLREGSARLSERYEPPPRPAKKPHRDQPDGPGSSSVQLDEFFTALDSKKQFDSQANALRSKLTKEIRQQRTLQEHLKQDLVRHGNPEEHKRTGDLLLANIATAVRDGNKVRITDYYSDGAPTVEIEVDENRSLQDEATTRFRQYTKSKRAGGEIAARLDQIDRDTAALESASATPRPDSRVEGSGCARQF